MSAAVAIGLGITGVPGAQVPGAVISGVAALSGLAAAGFCNAAGVDYGESELHAPI